MDIKTLCLGLLTSGQATGYDLKKHFESTFSHFYTAGYGSIYPALADLAETGLVSCTEVSEKGKPAKKVYRITPAGEACFQEALKNACPCHKLRSEFLAMMFFAQQMDARQIDALLNHRLTDIDQKLTMLAASASEQPEMPLGPDFVRGFGEAVLTAARDYIRGQQDRLRAESGMSRAQAQGNSSIQGCKP